MKERIQLRRIPCKRTLEEFLEGLEDTPTVIFNKEKGRFERSDNPNPLCQVCGEPMTKKGSSYYCEKDRIYEQGENWNNDLMKEKL